MKPPRHLRRLVPYLRRHRKRLLAGLTCLLLRTAFSVASPWVLRYAVDDLTLGVTRDKLLAYAGLIVGVVAVEGIFLYQMRMILIGVSREIEYELRGDLFAHLTRLPARYYQQMRTGDLMSRATSDLSAVRMVLGPGIMYTASTVATFLGTIAFMAAISPWLLALSLVPLLFVTFLVRYFGRRIHDRFEAVQAQLSDLSALVQENLSGARVVRAYVQEAHEMARFEAANAEYLLRNRQLIRMFGSLYPGIQLLMGVSAAFVLWLGGRMVITGSITLGEFVAFGAYLAMLHWPMIALGWVVNLFERGDASMGRLLEILDAAPLGVAAATPNEEHRRIHLGGAPPGDAIAEPQDEHRRIHFGGAKDGDDAAAPDVPAIRGHVRFSGLTFAYADRPVLHDIDLDVPAGSTVAIVGPTGSGKSTLVSLVGRLFEAPPGTVLLDGRDVRTIPLATLRKAVGYVPQETFLFSATVRENIALGLPSSDREGVEWAAGIAQLARDVADFPQGYETFVGERGITLSGGQKQRTALARALAVDPRILVLDDALSSVDTHTEEEILRGLRGVMAARTTFLVSHRVSTVKGADLIVVLKDGRIVERGTHAELVGRGGFYADLHRRQLLEEEMEQTA